MFQAGPAAGGRANLVATVYSIIYVRGNTRTQSEVESTFNLGPTQFELSAGSEAKISVFESPVTRLINEEDSQDACARCVDPRNRPIADSVADTRGEPKHDYRRSSENEAHSGVVDDELFFELPAGATRYLEDGCLRVLFDAWE